MTHYGIRRLIVVVAIVICSETKPFSGRKHFHTTKLSTDPILVYVENWISVAIHAAVYVFYDGLGKKDFFPVVH
jgi:hypothetical protein